MPPADLVPEVIRQLALKLNITNAAILFDKNFVMNHKYKSLLLNVPTRHVINELDISIDKVKRQLVQLRDLDVVNYLLLGETNSVKVALDAGERLGFTGRKYGWFIISLDEEVWPSCACHNVTLLFLKPLSVGDKTQEESVARATLPKPFISSAFYYDLTLLGVNAMKLALDNGEWPLQPRHINCDSYNMTNKPVRGLDLLAKLVAVSKNMTPTYAGIVWGKNNGEHRAKFDMSMHMVNIERGKISLRMESGIWRAGVDTPLQASHP